MNENLAILGVYAIIVLFMVGLFIFAPTCGPDSERVMLGPILIGGCK